MKKFLKILIITAASWLVITLFAQFFGSAEPSIHLLTLGKNKMALVLYNPDPFYNFDEQICNSFARGLHNEGISAVVSPTNKIDEPDSEYDLIVFCANTYNFAPDWKIQRCIKEMDLNNKKVVAITLGAGSTDAAQKKMEILLNRANANLLDSRSYWLMRPNDENRLDESNIDVAVEMARQLGIETAQKLDNF